MSYLVDFQVNPSGFVPGSLTVQTTGNQYISGQKTFFDQLTVSGKTGDYFNIPFTSGNWSGITNNIQFNSTGASITGSSFIYGELIHTGHILSGNKNYKITTIVSGYPTQVELWVGNQTQYFYPSYPLISGYNILVSYTNYYTSGYIKYKTYANGPRLTFVKSEVIEITGNPNIIENDTIIGGKLIANNGIYMNGITALSYNYTRNSYYIPFLSSQNFISDYLSTNTLYGMNPSTYGLISPWGNFEPSTKNVRIGDYDENYYGNYIFINNDVNLPSGYVALAAYYGKIYTTRDEWSPIENVLDDGFGNMGIGVENPTCKLDVNGVGKFSNGLSVSGYSVITSNQTGQFLTYNNYRLSGLNSNIINYSSGDMFYYTLTGNTSFIFTNTISGKVINIAITNITGTNYTCSWSITGGSLIKWPNSLAPTQSSGATDIYTFMCITGSGLYASVVQKFAN